MTMRRQLLLLLLLLVVANARVFAAGRSAHDAFDAVAPSDGTLGVNAPADRALAEGRVAEATEMLHATLASVPGDAMAHQLLCRVFYAQDHADEAIGQCEQAVRNDGTDSDNFLWLGRAFGMKARRVGPLAGFVLARKVRASFERAVELDPMNVAAFNDLGEYYVDAPDIVGGGNDKARALAARMMAQFPSSAHRLLAWLALEDKDTSTAEAEFKLAVSEARENAAAAWIDLAQFYLNQHRADEAIAAVRSGLAADRTHGPVLVDAASILTLAHREPALAEHCLADYLVSHARSDAAPSFKVHLQLSRLLAARHDQAGAEREVAAATALAPAFARHTRSAEGL